MKIAILADPIDNQKAGIHYYTRKLVENLGSIDSNIEYYAILQKHHPEFENIKQIILKPKTYIPVYKAYRMFFEIPAILKKLKIDIAVEPAHFGPFNLPEKIKRVTVIHDLTPILYPQYHVFHSQLLQRIFLKGILKKADLIITNSLYTSQDVYKVYPFTKEKTEFIHLGKDEDIHQSQQTSEVLTKLGINTPYLLFVGTIEPRKNLNILLKAFEAIKNEGFPKLNLVIVGQKGWKSKSFFQLYEQHPYRENIILPGYVDRKDLSAIYTAAYAYIQPSMYEGFGLPVVEAMSCGTPCIVSDISSLPEIGGDAVLTFNCNSLSDLESRMKDLLHNPELRDRLSKLSLERSKLFNWKFHAEKFDQLMKKLIII